MSDCPLKPLFARVVMKRESLKAKGIIIPETVQKRNALTRGVVVAVGPTADKSIRVGKAYIHGRFAGDWINVDGGVAETDESKVFYVLQDEELIAEVEDVRAAD